MKEIKSIQIVTYESQEEFAKHLPTMLKAYYYITDVDFGMSMDQIMVTYTLDREKATYYRYEDGIEN